MALPVDAAERAELCALMDELGPDAPTLCGTWTTAELAAHLVARERNPLSGPGIVLGGPFEQVTAWAMDRELRHPYERIVDRVRTGPPLVPWRVPVVRTWLNLNEYFVHHEDVRRANGLGPRPADPRRDGALTSAVRRMATLALVKGRVEAQLCTDDGTTIASRGVRPASVIGAPGELLLWLNGRADAAEVRFDGTDRQLAALWNADLGI